MSEDLRMTCERNPKWAAEEIARLTERLAAALKAKEEAERDAERLRFCVTHHWPRVSFNPPTGKTYWFITGFNENLNCATALQAIDAAIDEEMKI